MNDEESKKRLSEALEDLLLEEDIENLEIKEESDFENDFQYEKKQNCDIFLNNEPTKALESQTSKKGANQREKNEILWKPGPSTKSASKQDSEPKASHLPPNIVINSKIDAFHQFISDEILELGIQHTNQRGIYIKEHDPNFQWTPLDKIELSAFLGLLIFHGVMKGRGKPFHEFWSQEFGFPIFTATMTHKRMLDIIRCLRFDNMDTRVSRRVDSGDKAEAVREFLNLFSLKCRTSFICSSDVVIGERFCCRKLKPDSVISSKSSQIEIFYALDIYNNYITNFEIPSGELSRENIVLDLTEHLNDSGRNIITDFGCYFLSEKLKERNLRLTGCLSRSHEDLPKEFLAPKPNPISYHVEDTTLFFSNPSSVTDPKIILSTLKFQDAKEAAAFYDEKIVCLHRLERRIEKYSVKRNSRRWPLLVFYNVIDVAAWNAFSIYKYVEPSFERRKFLLDLAKELVEGHVSRRLTSSANEKICNAVAIIGLKHLFSKKSLARDEIFETRKMKQTATRKRGRCFNCPRSMDRKSSEKCDKCFAFVCTEHRGVLCVMCFRRDTNLEENED